MNHVERQFLLAVERGDIDTLKQLLEDTSRKLNINCCDPLARNALVIAIDNENLPIMKLLIDAGIEIADALLYAIDENFIEAVELLLDHEQAIAKPGMPRSWEKDRENSTFSADLTPLILAAHRNNFEIIKMLLDRRISPTPDPHDPRCHCKLCQDARLEDCLKHSRSRINAYRALASPCFMALSSADPMLVAFELSAKLESLAKMEPEYKQDYLRLRGQCQTFATRLLDYTRTSKELEILLNYSEEFLDGEHDPDPCSDFCCCQPSLYQQEQMSTMRQASSSSVDMNPGRSSSSSSTETRSFRSLFPAGYVNDHLWHTKKDSMLSLDSVTGKHESYRSNMRLARLTLAIQCKQKTFCAHPNIQELLATMWYENLPGFRRKNAFAQALQIILIGIMFPIYSIAYLVAPDSQLGRYIKKPFIKFICHSASYITFLIVLILASQRVEAFYNWNSVLSLFSLYNLDTNSILESNITIHHQTIKQPRHSYDPDDLIALLSSNPRGATTSARGLESLSKIFMPLAPSSKRRGSLPSPIEVVILVWVTSLIWAELKQLRALGINYYKADMWNTLDSVASTFYIGTVILRVISYLQADESSGEVAREHWHAYDPILLSEGLFAAATIFSALKLIYIFSVNPYLGPLQISLGRMIIDILRFSWIYLLVLFSFACGMNQLLWYYADLERHQCVNVTNYNLAQYYSAQQEHERQLLAKEEACDQNSGLCISRSITNSTLADASMNANQSSNPNIKKNLNESEILEAAFSASMEDDSSKPPVTVDSSCKTWRYFSNVFESTQTLFWATFGLVDLENFDLTGIRQYTRFWALLMFGVYCFINVIVVLNLLIAMMNHSYVKISKKSDIEWKFARTRLWMSYFDTGSTVPAPFNIVPSIKSTRNCIMYLFRQLAWVLRQIKDFKVALFGRLRMQLSRTGVALGPNGTQPVAPPFPTALGDILGAGGEPRPTRRWVDPAKQRERARRNCSLTASYRHVMRALVRRYLVNEQRLVERKRELTEAKLDRWAKLNAFDS